MSSFTGDPRHRNALSGQSDTKNAQARIQQSQDIHESDSQDTSDLYKHNRSSKVTFDSDYAMETPSEAYRRAREERKAKEDAEHAALNALLEQVTKEVQESGKSAFLPDGDRTRFEKFALGKNDQDQDPDGNNLRPQPLQPHNAFREMAASGEKKETLVDFLKESEALAILHEQQISATAAQRAAAEMTERLKQSDTPLLSSLRRKLSSTFVKDAPEQPKRVDQDSPSQLHSKGTFFRKASGTKSNMRGDGLQSISENDTASVRASSARSSARASSDVDNKSSQGREEQFVRGKSHDSGYSNKEHTNPTPALKASTSRPSLSVDTSQASRNMDAPVNDSAAPKSLAAKDRKDSKQSSPNVVEPSSKSSPRFMKPKTPRFKDSDPEVKALERMILQEEFGVNTTSELTSAYRKRAPTPVTTAPRREHIMSFAESAAVSYLNRLRGQSQPNSSHTTRISESSTDPVHRRETSDNSMESTGSVVRHATGPHNSFGSALSASDTCDSRASTFPSSALRTSGGTIPSLTAPSTPDTSNAGGSLLFRRKEVGSGYSHENSGSWSASPTSYLAGVTGYPRTGQYSSGISQSPVKQGIGRSFTDPYDGQASIGSIHTMSPLEGSHADSSPNRTTHPLRSQGGGSLEASSGQTNTSSDMSPYELDVLQPRGHKLNEFIIPPNAPSGAMLPNSPARDPRGQHNQPDSGLDEQGANPMYTSSAQANSPSNAISGNISGPSDDTNVGTLPAPLVSGHGSSQANFPDVQGSPATVPSPSHPSMNTVVRDFQNLQTAGAPSHRLELEESAEADRRRRRMTKQNYVAYRLHILRKKTNTQIIPWDGHDNYPRHPNHGRKFHSANLWCNECTDKCARCSASCCVLKAASLTAMSDRVAPLQKADAVALQKEIQTWLATGVDNRTFMDCTECKQFVCPQCTSICPVEPCCDRLCIGCNPEHFWQPCDYHTQEDVNQAFKRQRERMEDNLVFFS